MSSREMSESSCVFCGSGDAVESVVFPLTFTAYQLLQAGDKACGRCAEMFCDPKYRRNSWVLKNGKLEVIVDALEFLLSLPEPPFILYFTRSKRKHGWIRAVQNPVLSTVRFILVVDEDKILFDAEVFMELYVFAKRLFDRHIPKAVLVGGMPVPSVHRKYGLSWEESFRLRDLKSNMLWRFVVEFKRRD
jgi:hypothetical protein